MLSSFLSFVFLISIYVAAIVSILFQMIRGSGKRLPVAGQNILKVLLGALSVDLAIVLFFGYPYAESNFAYNTVSGVIVGRMYLITLFEMIVFLILLLYYRYRYRSRGHS